MVDRETLPRRIRKAAQIYKRKDFPLGPMEHLNKKHNAHRDFLIPRMQSRFEFFAKANHGGFVGCDAFETQEIPAIGIFMVSAFAPSRFLNIEASATSAANLEWYVRELVERGRHHDDPFGYCNDQASLVSPLRSTYLQYLNDVRQGRWRLRIQNN